MATSMNSRPGKIEIFFFPFLSGGHLMPMIDLARLFASHGVASTILTIPSVADVFHDTIARDQASGLDIRLHTLPLPASDPLSSAGMSASPFTDTSVLLRPLADFLLHHRPDCVITDTFHRWVPDTVDPMGIPRVIFTGNCCFSRCADHCVKLYSPHDHVASDSEPFVLPNLPDHIEMTRSQLSIYIKTKTEFVGHLARNDENSLGRVVNSFYELEPAYADYYREEMGKRAWLIGPVSLCNCNAADKTERGQKAVIDEHNCLNWLNSKKPKSVLYISFGSLMKITAKQVIELAHGLESSGCCFIWVVGKTHESERGWEYIPEGFEERAGQRGLVIKGWAPQLLILENNAIGGFMTHCGWNSTLEGICAGVPMITFPLSAEQFYNEKLVTDVLGMGVKVGSEEWGFPGEERKTVVGREKVEAAVKRLMGGSDEAAEMGRKAKELEAMAKRAVEEGGSSYNQAEDFIETSMNLPRLSCQFPASNASIHEETGYKG